MSYLNTCPVCLEHYEHSTMGSANHQWRQWMLRLAKYVTNCIKEATK